MEFQNLCPSTHQETRSTEWTGVDHILFWAVKREWFFGGFFFYRYMFFTDICISVFTLKIINSQHPSKVDAGLMLLILKSYICSEERSTDSSVVVLHWTSSVLNLASVWPFAPTYRAYKCYYTHIPPHTCMYIYIYFLIYIYIYFV